MGAPLSVHLGVKALRLGRVLGAERTQHLDPFEHWTEVFRDSFAKIVNPLQGCLKGRAIARAIVSPVCITTEDTTL